jgi:hypothetical protein
MRELVYDVSDEVFRQRDRGHTPMRDDKRRGGRKAYVCTRCGLTMAWTPEQGWQGTLALGSSRCFDFEPKSRRQNEIEQMDAEEGWTGLSAIAEANWATRASAGMARSLSRSGR